MRAKPPTVAPKGQQESLCLGPKPQKTESGKPFIAMACHCFAASFTSVFHSSRMPTYDASNKVISCLQSDTSVSSKDCPASAMTFPVMSFHGPFMTANPPSKSRPFVLSMIAAASKRLDPEAHLEKPSANRHDKVINGATAKTVEPYCVDIRPFHSAPVRIGSGAAGLSHVHTQMHHAGSCFHNDFCPSHGSDHTNPDLPALVAFQPL